MISRAPAVRLADLGLGWSLRDHLGQADALEQIARGLKARVQRCHICDMLATSLGHYCFTHTDGRVRNEEERTALARTVQKLAGRIMRMD